MKTLMFSVFDSKAGNFTPPFFSPTKGMAIRMFTDVANDVGTMICKHPEDFSLIYVGVFDDENGVCEAARHENLGVAASYKKPDIGLAGKGVLPLVVNGQVHAEEVSR